MIMAKCPTCSKDFFCGIESDEKDCWCLHEQKKQPEGDKCYCKECFPKLNDR